MIRVKPNDIHEGDYVEAQFPCGCIERGVAVLEDKAPYHCRYRNKRRMMLCEDGKRSGHIITDCAGFRDGTQFFVLTPEEYAIPKKGKCSLKSQKDV